MLRADPWQIIRSGSSGIGSLRRFTLRDVLLALQIAICAVLVTASLVAVRGLARSLHSDYGFQPQGCDAGARPICTWPAMTAISALHMQRRMLDAAAAIPGVTAVGYADRLPLSIGGNDSSVFADTTTDYRPDQFRRRCAAVQRLAGLLPRGRNRDCWPVEPLRLNDDSKAPLVAVVNREFARKVLGSVEKAVGGHFKVWGGKRVEVVGVVEDGKYETLTEDQQPAMFYSFLQQPSSNAWIIVRSQRDPQEIAAALQRALRSLDPALPIEIKTWNSELDSALFAARVATVALGVLGLLGAMLAITGIFGMASYVVSKRLRELGIRVALGANQRKVLGAALGRAFRLLAIGSAAGMILGVLATRVLVHIVYQATPKDPIVLVGVILAMLARGPGCGMDSGAARTRGRSDDPAARGIEPRSRRAPPR